MQSNKVLLVGELVITDFKTEELHLIRNIKECENLIQLINIELDNRKYNNVTGKHFMLGKNELLDCKNKLFYKMKKEHNKLIKLYEEMGK